ncbi:branched-chain amino acid ABC transporter permease, partial [Burkholderia sp. KCJ3K979]|nr:branched-chain amino acid ABC transporter permease [Burkholderia sp. KCJ3K979]
DLPYRLALPIAVLAALAAGCTADFFVERADWRRIRTETVHEKDME